MKSAFQLLTLTLTLSLRKETEGTERSQAKYRHQTPDLRLQTKTNHSTLRAKARGHRESEPRFSREILGPGV
jgi:hypothetical protein